MASILTRNKEGVLKVYNEVHKCPVFAIYEGNRQLTCCTDDSQKKRLAALGEFLEIMEQSGTTASFDLRCYEAANKNGKVNTNDPYFAFLPFKVCDGEKAIEMLQQKGGAPVSGTADMMMKLFEAKLENYDIRHRHELEKKDEEILKLQQQLIDADDDDDYEDDRLGQVLGAIGSVGEKHPWMQDLLKNFGNTVNNMLRSAQTKFTSMTETPMAVNGVEPEPAADKSLDEQLKWANLTLVNCYRVKYGVKMDQNGAPVNDPENNNKLTLADTAYVLDIVNLAKLASTKPETYDTARGLLKSML